MGRRLTLILGGARSGKSAYAQQLAAERGKRVLYVATAEPGDEEMAARIAAHRAERPTHWHTLEAPREVGRAIGEQLSVISDQSSGATPHALRPTPDVILLDCLTLLANNLIAPLPDPVTAEAAENALTTEVDLLLTTYHSTAAEWIVISNEVGLGLVPPYPLGRAYRDALGRANQRIAREADEVVLMVAGIPMVVKNARN